MARTHETRLGALREEQVAAINARYWQECQQAARRRDEDLQLLADLCRETASLVLQALDVRARRTQTA